MTSAAPSTVVTRFAPSPTGYPPHRRRAHGACSTGCSRAITAANICCGSRIPTAPARPSRRSTRSSTGSSWLGIEGDGEPYFQSQFEARHAEVAHELIERGAAYRCYLTQEELAARREAAQAERRPFRIDSEWRDRDRRARPTQPFVVRIKAPKRGRDGDRRPRPGPGHGRQCRARRFRPAALRRHARPTCWRWWSTIMTWASPTSSAATTISTTPSASWRSSARWTGPSRPTPISR